MANEQSESKQKKNKEQRESGLFGSLMGMAGVEVDD
jgi:hypothetical protein